MTGPADLLRLAAGIAAAGSDLAIAGEGNLSFTDSDGGLVVTPSGSRLAELNADDLVAVDAAVLRDAVHRAQPDDEWLSVLLASRIDPASRRPTVEVALHAVIGGLVGEGVIAHTHPTDVLAVLCSARSAAFATTRLFPDHVVALGVADALIPYTDPGRELAVAASETLVRHRETYGEWPRMILAENHGVFALGASGREALDRTLMVAKAARIFLAGGDRGLSREAVDRIAGREDEAYRRAQLAGGAHQE